jgi:hypothetical protein
MYASILIAIASAVKVMGLNRKLEVSRADTQIGATRNNRIVEEIKRVFRGRKEARKALVSPAHAGGRGGSDLTRR